MYINMLLLIKKKLFRLGFLTVKKFKYLIDKGTDLNANSNM